MRDFFSYLVLSFVGLILLLLGFVMITHWRDEPLREDVRALVAYEPALPEQLEDNGYLIVAGIDAPWSTDEVEGADTQAAALGLQRLQRERERYAWSLSKRGDNDEKNMPEPFTPVQTHSRYNMLADEMRCPQASASRCHQWYAQHAERIRPALASHQSLLARYEAASRSERFSNPFPRYANEEHPPYQIVISAHELQLAGASLRWNEGRHAEAMRMIEAGNALSERLANSSEQLIGSMIALSMQYRTLRWLSDVIASTQDPIAPDTQARIQRVLHRPVVSMRAGFVGEMHYVFTAYQSVQSAQAGVTDKANQDLHGANWVYRELLSGLYLPHETMNRQMDWWQRYLPVVDAPAHELDALKTRFEEQWKTAQRQDRFGSFGLRNYFGNYLFHLANFNYESYLWRRHDVDAYRRMVGLQWAAREQVIARDQMQDWLARSPEALRNPYTLEPMQWDAHAQALLFEGRTAQPQHPDKPKTYRVQF